MHIYVSQKVWADTSNKVYNILMRYFECWKNQWLEVICADSEVISIYNLPSIRNGITMTLSLASYSAESFEGQVSDVVELLTLISTEFHIWLCFTFVLKVAFIAG